MPIISDKHLAASSYHKHCPWSPGCHVGMGQPKHRSCDREPAAVLYCPKGREAHLSVGSGTDALAIRGFYAALPCDILLPNSSTRQYCIASRLAADFGIAGAICLMQRMCNTFSSTATALTATPGSCNTAPSAPCAADRARWRCSSSGSTSAYLLFVFFDLKCCA